MKVEKNCWATVAVDVADVVKALVHAKALRRTMTKYPLMIIISHLIPGEFKKLLQLEFDIVIQLDQLWSEEEELHPLKFAKFFVWSLHKWDKIVFLHPNTLVLRNCDEIFRKELFSVRSFEDTDVCVINPSSSRASWRKMRDLILKLGVRDEVELYTQVFLPKDVSELEECYNLHVDLESGNLAKELKEFGIVSFSGGVHPLDFLPNTKTAKINGILESAVNEIWINHFEHGVAETLSQLRNIPALDLKWLSQKISGRILPTPSIHSELLENCKDAIAIVGMSCRFPGANSVEEFWQLLVEGRDAMGPAPNGRWAEEKCPLFPHETAPLSDAGFLKLNIDEFDGKFFGISPTDLNLMDPQQRLTLQMAWESLEDAGINPLSLNGTHTGVFAGSWRQDYREALQDCGYDEAGFLRSFLGNSMGVISARISHVLGLTGPSVSTESGCSSSLVAVHLACTSLLQLETDLAMACGVNLVVHPFTGASMTSVLAADGRCKTFDESADGFARADGAAALVLKRYADAIRDNDRIYSIIRGSAVVQEGASKSLGTPTTHCEALAMSLALKNAGVAPGEVSYVETHGTGTPVGDPLEVAAVAKAYYVPNREDPLIIGSVKTNIGHTESCAGIAGLMKVVLSLQNELIPPHINFKKLNPAINLDCIPAQIPLHGVAWPRIEGKPRIAGISSFGITGTDSHAIIQETPVPTELNPPVILDYLESGLEKRPMEILTISGKTDEALNSNLRQWERFLESSPEEQRLIDLCHAGNAGRGSYPFRVAVLGHSKQELLDNLLSSELIRGSGPASNGEKKICFLFTGQGSQYPGMAKELYNTSLTFKLNFDNCDRILSYKFKINIRDALWGSDGGNLGRTIYSQTSIFVVEYCMLKLWESWGIKPSMVLGHSLGEFAAGVAAGILSFEDALTLVAERSRLIDELPGGKMLVVKDSLQGVESHMKNALGNDGKKWLDIAAVNSPDQTVVAGDTDIVEGFAKYLKGINIKCIILDSSHAFHSSHMDPMLSSYRSIAQGMSFNKPKIPYVSGMDGKIVPIIDAEYWVRHTRDRVRFMAASHEIMSSGVDCSLFLELGPQPVLSALILMNSDDAEVSPKCFPSIRKQEKDWSCLLNTLGKLWIEGVPIDWEGFNQWNSIQKQTAPFYPFQNKSYWLTIPDRGPKEFHPLVGKSLSNPSNVKIFTQNLKLEFVPYIRDHGFASKILFPGAGYMEMCMTAGHAAGGCGETGYFHPIHPVALEEFIITSPMSLSEGEAMQLQSVVTTEESGEIRVNIYSKLVIDKDTWKWVKHATAVYNSYTDVEDIQGAEPLESIRGRLTCRRDFIDSAYQKLDEVGVRLRGTFQTMKNMWGPEKIAGDISMETLFEVDFSEIDDMSKDKYIMHPLIPDVFLQAFAMVGLEARPNASLQLPVSAKKYVVYERLKDVRKCYVYCYNSSDHGDMMATLFTEEGRILSKVSGVVFMETSIESMMSILDSQRLSLPGMFEEVWRAHMGIEERRVELKEAINRDIFSKSYANELVASSGDNNNMGKGEMEQKENIDGLCGLYLIKALHDLNFGMELNSKMKFSELVKKLSILPSFEGFSQFLFNELKKEKFIELSRESDELYIYLVNNFPPASKTQEQIKKLKTELPQEQIQSISFIGSQLGDILRGRKSPQIDISQPLSNNGMEGKSYLMMKDVLSKAFEKINSIHEENNCLIRVLEIGGGAGEFTRTALSVFSSCSSAFEYTFSDKSPSWVENGARVFEGSNVTPIFKTLDINEDLWSQGCIPEYFDIILLDGGEISPKDDESLTKLRSLLRSNGVLFLTEHSSSDRLWHLSSGLLKNSPPYIHVQNGKKGNSSSTTQYLLQSSGFNSINSFQCPLHGFTLHTAMASSSDEDSNSDPPSSKADTWLIFGSSGVICNISYSFTKYLRQLNNNVILIEPGKNYKKNSSTHYIIPPGGDHIATILNEMKGAHIGSIYLWGLNPTLKSGELAQSYLQLCKNLIGLDAPKLFCITRGIFAAADDDINTPASSVLMAMTKCFGNEHTSSISRVVDLRHGDEPREEEIREAFSELFVDDEEIYVAYRNHQRILPRLVQINRQVQGLPIPESGRYQLVLPSSNAIRDLRFAPMPPLRPIGEEEILISIKAYSLNFRDVFAVLKPSKDFDRFNVVGVDWAGEIIGVGSGVTKHGIGDQVFGMYCHDTSLASHLQINQNGCAKIMQGMTYGEAATISLAAITAFECLIKLAELKKEDTILIHCGAGGVGLTAIQIAQHIGCRIIATAGNRRKRAYLRSLGIEHVYSSRNLDYGKQIPIALGGGGIDVVLNSLTSTGFKEASLSVCNQGARFIEMSKWNIWNEKEIHELRPDMFYSIIDVSVWTFERLEDSLHEISAYFETFDYKTMPYVRFDASEIREALTYLQRAKHIGKIVVTMPDREQGFTPMFNDNSTYIITGGLGGIGFEICKWMLGAGAKHVALVGRSKPSDKVREEISRLNVGGVKHVFPLQYDVGDELQCRALFDYLENPENNLPTVRGVMHAAGILSDGTYENQNWEKYENVFRPKVDAGWNLHKMTLKYPMEHFVMFSSVVSTFGSMGQSNYSAANFYLDSLVQYRNYCGLKGTTVNWGQWGQVGMCANMEIPGFRPISILQGISSLERIMKSQRLNTVVAHVNFGIMKNVGGSISRFVEEIKTGDETAQSEILVNNVQFWKDYDSCTDDAGRLEVVKRLVITLSRQLLKMSDKEVIRDDDNFQDLGMDSLMMIEMKNVMQSLMGNRAKITVNAVKDCHTVMQLSVRLIQLLNGDAEVPTPQYDELRQLMAEDATLPEGLTKPFIPACKPSEVKSVFVTGCTGNMGPHFILNLSQRPEIEKIYCLVRESGKGAGKQLRLQNTLEERGLLSLVDMKKIIIVNGVVNKKKFGLSEQLYEELSVNVDAVIHMAVKSSFVDAYKKDDRVENDIRSVNVNGLKEVLQFVCSHRTKLLFHSSTALANATISEDNTLAETWPVDEDFDQCPNNAYPVSKFVCERIMRDAVLKLEIPAKIFRFPAVGGDRDSGRMSNYENNQLMLRMMSYIHLGMIPDVPLPLNILPVDLCSEVSLQLFFNDSTPFEIYNIYNPFGFRETEFSSVAEQLGYKLKIMGIEEFEEQIKSVKDSVLIHLIKEALKTDAQSRFDEHPPQFLEAYDTNSKNVFVSKKLKKYLPNYPKQFEDSLKIIKRDLIYARDSGTFKKFGI